MHINMHYYTYITLQINMYMYVLHTVEWEKLMVIKFDGLPSKYILLILMGYNLTDWVSTTVWYNNYTKLAGVTT